MVLQPKRRFLSVTGRLCTLHPHFPVVYQHLNPVLSFELAAIPAEYGVEWPEFLSFQGAAQLLQQ